MQCACTILSSVACTALLYFCTLYRKRQDIFFFLGGGLLNVKCVFWFSLEHSSEKFLVVRIQRDVINVHPSSCKVPVTVVPCKSNINFLCWFSKDIKFHEKPSRGSRVVACGRNDRYDEANGLLDDSLASEFYMRRFGIFCLFHLLYSFFLTIPRRLNFMCRRFETLCSIFIDGVSTSYEDGTDSVPKRRHIRFGWRGMIQENEYKIQNTAKNLK